jgi:SAM-dependent methyltransferase
MASREIRGEDSSGLKAVLTFGSTYNFFQNAIIKKPIWRDICRELFHLEDTSKIKVLDIGCGTGNFLQGGYMKLPQNQYVGIDPSENYINSAKSNFPEAVFHKGLVSEVELEPKTFRLVVLSGVLHHLNDDEATEVIKYAKDKVIDGGYVVSVDPVVFDRQNWFARRFALADRGQHVRSPGKLTSIWQKSFDLSEVSISLRSGYLRVPYNHAVCVAQPRGQAPQSRVITEGWT